MRQSYRCSDLHSIIYTQYIKAKSSRDLTGPRVRCACVYQTKCMEVITSKTGEDTPVSKKIERYLLPHCLCIISELFQLASVDGLNYE